MYNPLNHPFHFFLICLILMLAAAWGSAWLGEWRTGQVGHSKDPFTTVEGATLGLLGLLLGFTFAMAVTRYDLRVQLEVDEANSIEKTWLRAGTLPDPLRDQSRLLLQSYVKARLDLADAGLNQTAAHTAELHARDLQKQLWVVCVQASKQDRDSISAAYMNALNEMIDMQTRRAEALANQIPATAWFLLVFIATISTGLIGYDIGAETRGERGKRWVLNVLPVVLSVVLMLICDLDTPRSGLIRVDQHAMIETQREIR
jgi:hypothetical protein